MSERESKQPPASQGEPETGHASDEVPVPGVTALDHTADVGLEVQAQDLAELLERAAVGMDWLLREAEPPAEDEERTLHVEGADPPSLLRAFLRELLLWFERDGFAPSSVQVIEAAPGGVRARIRGGEPPEPPIREIKGVTLHGLTAEPRDGGWRGRVIFDV